jgi:CheY-like chemotaxis protein
LAKKILVIDDEHDICDVVKTLLEQKGYKVDIALGGKAALKMLEKKSDYDLLLIDFFMPGMSGKQLIKEIKSDSKLKKLKCAFLTVATFSPKGLEELKELGSLDYIRKPFDNEDLISRVKKLVK